MSRSRTTLPVMPIRYVHARRGSARAVQHVVAYRTTEPPPQWRTLLLCGNTLGDGKYLIGFDHEAMRARYSDRLGPKTSRPMITVHPVEGLSICAACAKALDAVGASA